VRRHIPPPPHREKNSGCAYATYKRCKLFKLYEFANTFRPLLQADKDVVYLPPPLSTLPELSGRIRAVTAPFTPVTSYKGVD